MKLDPHHPPEGTVRDWLAARARDGGTACQFPQENDAISWETLQNEATALAGALTAHGIGKGESVPILAPNGRFALTALYACLVGGFRAASINLAAGPEAIRFALTHSQGRAALVHAECDPLFASAAPPDLERFEPGGSGNAPLHAIRAEDDALLMYTSGTTGTPKGVLHSHASLLAGGWTTAAAHGLSKGDTGLCVLPIYHINGLCVSVMGSLVSGGSLAMVPRFSAGRFWDHMEETGATWVSVVPTIISHLLHGASAPPPETKARLRFVRSASSALAKDTQSAFEARFEVPIIETMGLTETAAQILSNPLPPGLRKIGSPGVSVGCDVQIQGPGGAALPSGEEGEIAIRGPNVMRGYLRNEAANSQTFRGGWLRTGDLGRMDRNGYVFVTGRLKELIIKGGENIAPREIDEVLYGHKDVLEAAAFGRPCPSYGERVEAAVVLKEGASTDVETLMELVRGRLGPFKAPEYLHLMEELPKGPSGKIQRLKLCEVIPKGPG